MRNVIITSILLISNIVLVAQTFTPISFKGYTPKWIHTSIDSSVIGIDLGGIVLNGYNNIAWAKLPLISYPFAYIVHERVATASEGAFIEKLNLNTGKVSATAYYDLRNNDQKEIPAYRYFNDRGELEILNFRKNDTFPYIWAYAVFSSFRFDTSDLSLNEHVYGDGSDSLTKILRVSGGENITNRSIYPYANNQYYYFSYGFPTYYELRCSWLDEKGYEVKDTSIVRKMPFIPNNRNTYTSKAFRISKDSFMIFNYAINEKGDTSLGYFEYMDRNLNSIGLYDITNDLNTEWLYYPVIVNDENVVLRAEEWLDEYGLKKKYHYIVYNNAGELIEKIPVVGPNGNNIALHRILTLKNNKGVLLFATDHDEQIFYIMKSDGKGGLNTIKQLRFLPEPHFFIPRHITELDNGDILVYGRQGYYEFNPNRKYIGVAYNWILFDAKDLGLISSNMDVADKENQQFKIYPNPAKDELTISFQHPSSGVIQVVTTSGETILKKRFDQRNDFLLDISEFNAGIYHMRFLSDDENTIYEVQSFVKE